jgi:hypothetical protein
MLKTRSFENVKNQIGFCGIWCGSCVVGNETLRELTRRYEEIVKGYGLESWAPKDFDFKELVKALASIQAMPLCLGCLKGDGKPDCEIRICALDKNIADCSVCDEQATCTNSEMLHRMREGARRAGLFVKTKNADRQELIEKWTADLESRWPCCILFSRARTI